MALDNLSGLSDEDRSTRKAWTDMVFTLDRTSLENISQVTFLEKRIQSSSNLPSKKSGGSCLLPGR